MLSKSIEALSARLGELRLIKDQIITTQNLIFDAHLHDELMMMHQVLGNINTRIEQLEIILERHRKLGD